MTGLFPQIRDPDVKELAALSGSLSSEYVDDEPDPWIGSPFAWIRSTSSSRRRGSIAERLVAGWFAMKTFDVAKSPNTDADRIIEGWRVEIKFSTAWEGKSFAFQQIRDQAYDFCLCLAVLPFDANAWLIPKSALHENVLGHTGQHGGASGADTAWIRFPVGRPPAWMSPYGDRLSDVNRLMDGVGRGPYG